MAKLIKGTNDFETWCKNNDCVELLNEWDCDKNELLPSECTSKSGKKVWWKHWHEETKQWHEWQALISNRTQRSSGCPYCSLGRPKLLKGFNDLATWCNKNGRTDILIEWDYEKNDCVPEECFSTTHKKIWWICNLGHSWDMTVAHRTSMGCGCPVCANLRIEVGYNDFETWCRENNRDELLREWDYSRNSCNPTGIIPQSHRKIYWKCDLGHTWCAVVKDRVNRGDGCPECSKRRRTSFPEQAIYFYIKQCFRDAVNSDRSILDGLELDIFIPSINVAIEYDGQAYHRNIIRDEKKNTLCQEKKVVLYRVRESGCEFGLEHEYLRYITVTPGDVGDLERAINILLCELLKTKKDTRELSIDIQRDRIKIQSAYMYKSVPDSFFANHPELESEWDYEKNGDITLDKLPKTSSQKFYWICTKGHGSYLSSLTNRYLGSGCPICSNMQLLKGYNDLVTWCIENNRNNLLEEWDYESNELGPDAFFPKSNKKVWWRCKNCGHKWTTKLEDRTSRERGCPSCAIRIRTRKNSKQVRNDDTGEIFENAKVAGEKYRGNICACCLGVTKTAGGYHWSYVEKTGMCKGEEG